MLLDEAVGIHAFVWFRFGSVCPTVANFSHVIVWNNSQGKTTFNMKHRNNLCTIVMPSYGDSQFILRCRCYFYSHLFEHVRFGMKMDENSTRKIQSVTSHLMCNKNGWTHFSSNDFFPIRTIWHKTNVPFLTKVAIKSISKGESHFWVSWQPILIFPRRKNRRLSKSCIDKYWLE